MVRLSCAVLIALSLPTAAWADPASDQDPSLRFLPNAPSASRFAATESFGRKQIAPNLQLGFGVYGLKAEKSPLRPVTRRELDLPKQRRAGVGLSLKF